MTRGDIFGKSGLAEAAEAEVNAVDLGRTTPAERLKQARVNGGFDSAAAAARAYGWTVSTYNAHENGQNGLTVEAAKRYGAAFGVDWHWLIGEPDEPRSTAPFQTAFSGRFDIKPQPEMWAAIIKAALAELGVSLDDAPRVVEVILSVAYAQLPGGLGMTEAELAEDLVQKGMRKQGLSRKSDKA